MSANASDPVFVLDSYALLAYLNAETGRERIVALLISAQSGQVQGQGGTAQAYPRARALLCTINLGEILYTVERRRGLVQAQHVQALLESLPIDQVEVTRDLVLDAAHIKASYPISYADAFVVALALREKATILTGDPEFSSVQTLVRVEWLET